MSAASAQTAVYMKSTGQFSHAPLGLFRLRGSIYPQRSVNMQHFGFNPLTDIILAIFLSVLGSSRDVGLDHEAQ